MPAESLRRFWIMIAHYHGQIWNASEFARAMHSAIESLGLERLWVVYPGDEPYALTKRISALPVSNIPAHVRHLRNLAPSPE